MAFRGSCLCVAVTYEATDRVKRLNLCHCRMCQKTSGSAYGAFLRIDKTGLQWRTGARHVSTFEFSPGVTRAFCSGCGSSLTWSRDDSDGVGIAAGTVDEGEVPDMPTSQFWCDAAPVWHQCRNDVEQFSTDFMTP
ncbi:MAG: ribulose phosphate epimerase [Gammaproteobacteria bacterium]|nr:ribulose phosphate epimerase [Gammaproteobacteria bacterium]RPG25305.1 MAG: GFA family protein [Gammaproteobacteria bacterium TMED50]